MECCNNTLCIHVGTTHCWKCGAMLRTSLTRVLLVIQALQEGEHGLKRGLCLPLGLADVLSQALYRHLEAHCSAGNLPPYSMNCFSRAPVDKDEHHVPRRANHCVGCQLIHDNFHACRGFGAIRSWTGVNMQKYKMQMAGPKLAMDG